MDDDGSIHIAWRKVFEGDIRDIVVSSSRDGGASFEPPVRVAEDNWQINGCPDVGPRIVSDGDRLAIAWYTMGADERVRVHLAFSADGGRSFSDALEASAGVVDATRPHLSAVPEGGAALVFQGREPDATGSWGRMRPYLVEVSAEGRVSPPAEIPGSVGSVSFPVVAAGRAGRIFASWTETGEDGDQVVFARGRRQSPDDLRSGPSNVPDPAARR
ncbi:MAG TPA: sialidase family protein [Acidobacteriota bacterium]|nr:sialidase family protein [Acidobacteriota bacterium]